VTAATRIEHNPSALRELIAALVIQ
jgi:hypothetical protein